MDFLTLDVEATLLCISKTKWKDVDSIINNDINEINVCETIKRILLVNDHTTLNINENVAYDVWESKIIFFCFENQEICFMKQDCWFSQEIEIYKEQDLLEKIGGGNGILDDFDNDDVKKAFIERTIVEIK